MTSLKSERCAELSFALPLTTESSAPNADTPLPQISGPATRCSECGSPKDPASATCRDCYTKRRSTAVQVICTLCGKEFIRPGHAQRKWLLRGLKDSYCSRECSNVHHAFKNAPSCEQCGTPMPKARGTRFCSSGCRAVAREAWKEAPVMIRCDFCDDEFARTAAQKANPKSSRYCGNACADAAHSLRMRGKGNSRYKTGTSYAKWYRDMRPLIVEREKHACAACGAAEVIRPVLRAGQEINRSTLHIHHINNDVRDNRAENLVALCDACHPKLHHSNGTKWQWLSGYAAGASQSMISKWKDAVTSLQREYSSTTA